MVYFSHSVCMLCFNITKSNVFKWS